MSEITTDASTQDEALQTAQPPVDEQPAEAITVTSEPTSPTEAPEGDEPDEPVDTDTSDDDGDLSDEQILAWAGKKGLDLSTPEGQAKALRSMRASEKKMHQATSSASELANQVGQESVDPDATAAEQALHMATQLRNAETIRNWKAQNNISAEEDVAMGNYAKENPETAQLLTQGLITLDQFRAMSRATTVDTAAAKAAGKKEALEDLATKQGAGSVAGGATSVSTSLPKTDAISDVWDNDND